MKIKLLTIFAPILFFPAVSWGLDCVKFEDMAVKILNQKEDKVNLEWEARVFNKCNKMVSLNVEISFMDSKGKHLESSLERLDPIAPNEVAEVRGEKNLPSKTYYKTESYYFKAHELKDTDQ